MNLRAQLHVAWCLSLCACSPPGSYRLVSFFVEAGGVVRAESGPLKFPTALGWNVTLESALLSVGPIYFQNAPPNLSTNTVSGRTVAQILSQFTIDTLDATPLRVEGGGNGITERALSCEVRWFDANQGPIADAVGSRKAVAYLKGVAEKDSVRVPFKGGLILDQALGQNAYRGFEQRRVEKIPVDFHPAQDGLLIMRVNPSTWLDSVAFDSEAKLPDGTVNLEDSALRTGLRDAIGASIGVYTFEWQPGP